LPAAQKTVAAAKVAPAAWHGSRSPPQTSAAAPSVSRPGAGRSPASRFL